jgi:hypothetical protein
VRKVLSKSSAFLIHHSFTQCLVYYTFVS